MKLNSFANEMNEESNIIKPVCIFFAFNKTGTVKIGD